VKTNLPAKAFCFWMSLLFLVSVAGCNYQRMKDQESVRTYKKEMPEMDIRSVPVQDGFQVLLTADPKTLVNPLSSTPQSVQQGKEAYGYFCIHCHGPKADGQGTVGQSFSPLPTDLRSDAVQGQSDGEIYAKTRLGYKRHPRLYTTISEPDTWAVVRYIRSLKETKAQKDN
jgi:mono/diheme cytochrome c family protein